MCLMSVCSVNEEVPGLFEDIPALIGRASCVMLALTIIAEVITGKVSCSTTSPREP